MAGPSNHTVVGKGAKWGVYFFSGRNNSASNERSSGLHQLSMQEGGGVVHGLSQTYPGGAAAAAAEAGAEAGRGHERVVQVNEQLELRVARLEALVYKLAGGNASA